MRINTIITKPLITEKATGLAAQSVYTFEINKNATKNQVRDLVEKMYGVEVKKVTVATREGKVRRVGKKQLRRKEEDRKIAYVTVTKGKIDLFPKA
ncbi:50S ribosomal protein L23 [Candidatus Roizmanbacteria bacterium]|nr:50S ribosomal protein L23 [Candidatus Roizmanbacteria bacterium]